MKKKSNKEAIQRVVDDWARQADKLLINDTKTVSFNRDKIKQQKAQERKNTPVYSGVLAYFPLVFGEIAKASLAGNKQHLDGQPLHWDRSKSTDQLDAGLRHLIDHARGEKIDDDGVRHLAKAIWRLMAQLQIDLEQ